jgi:hypothetical protein
MRTTHLRTAAIAMAATSLAGVLFWATGPAAADDGYGRHEQTLRLTTRTDQFAFADQNPPGPSVGDRLVFSDRVFRSGVQIGTAASTCTMVRVASPVATCLTDLTITLPDGQITLQGANDGPDHPPAPGEQVAFRLAVTGGTGQYRAARGDAEGIDAGGGEEQYTIHLTR